MFQTVKDYEFIGISMPKNYEFIGTSATTKHIIPQLFDECGYKILDIGFGRGELANLLSFHYNIEVDGVDAWEKTCQNPDLANYFSNVWCTQVEELSEGFLKQYDYIFLMDVIEHLEKPAAENLFKKILLHMNDDAKFVISTPLWFFPQGNVEPGDFEEHKCMIPLDSFLACKPIMYNINPVDLVGMFVYDKNAVFHAANFYALTDKSYGKRNAEVSINLYSKKVDEEWHKN